jgi:hypothetical protein
MMSSEEIKEHKTDLDPVAVAGWIEWTMPDIANFTHEWGDMIDKSETTFFAEYANSAVLRAQDKHNARLIKSMLHSKSQRVINFKAAIAARDTSEKERGSTMPRTSASGYRMWHAIVKSVGYSVSAERTARVKSFETKVYFAHTGTLEQFIGGANKMREDFALLPESEKKGDHALEKALLMKMPGNMSDTVMYYQKKIKKRESLEKGLKWDYNELTKLLADEYLDGG